ncbi:hypothetical protein Ancab_010548 [Ancistrocladus abbreviatus]
MASSSDASKKELLSPPRPEPPDLQESPDKMAIDDNDEDTNASTQPSSAEERIPTPAPEDTSKKELLSPPRPEHPDPSEAPNKMAIDDNDEDTSASTQPPSTEERIPTPSPEDISLSRSSHLTRQEVIRRRLHHVKQLTSVYRDYYWTLMEELRVQYKKYILQYGVSPFQEEVDEEDGDFIDVDILSNNGDEGNAESSNNASSSDLNGGQSSDIASSSNQNGGQSSDIASSSNQNSGESSNSASSSNPSSGESSNSASSSNPNSGDSSNSSSSSNLNSGDSGNSASIDILNSGDSSNSASSGNLNSGQSSDNAGSSNLNSGDSSNSASTTILNSGESSDSASGGNLNSGESSDNAGSSNLNIGGGEPLGESGFDPKSLGGILPCAFVGCTSKAMPLTDFCYWHILSDPRQVLYKACNYVIKSAEAEPRICGKPILRVMVPSLCDIHFQKSQKHVRSALEKAGLNASSSSDLAPKFNVIVAEYVKQIQAKRRALRGPNNNDIVSEQKDVSKETDVEEEKDVSKEKDVMEEKDVSKEKDVTEEKDVS